MQYAYGYYVWNQFVVFAPFFNSLLIIYKSYELSLVC